MASTLERTSPTKQGDAESETILVAWSKPHDPENPLQWTPTAKWTNVLIISLQGTLTPLASTLPAIATQAIAADFETTSSITPVLPIALFVLGLGLGPLYLAPLSELFGRRAVYITSFTIFAILNVGCALAPNLVALAILRLLSGMAGSAGPSLGGASIGDMFPKAERGKSQALYGFGPTGGPVLGGVLGGFILYRTGSWRWLMWIMVIAPAVTSLASVLLLRETYAPVILQRRAQALRRQCPHQVFRTDHDDFEIKNALLLSATRPLRMLVASPICASLAVYVAMVYGILYLGFLVLGLLFAPVPAYGLFTYGWSQGTSGLSYLGIGAGVFLGTFLSAKYADRIYRWRNRQLSMATQVETSATEASEPEQQTPESRLFLLQAGMLAIPVGLIMFAWSAGRTHWIVPLLGHAIFGAGMIVAYVAFQTYMVDIFGRFAASALATATILRSILGCVLSLVGFDLYRHLNYDWGTMVLAFLCIAMLPLPVILMRVGPTLRKKKFTF